MRKHNPKQGVAISARDRGTLYARMKYYESIGYGRIGPVGWFKTENYPRVFTVFMRMKGKQWTN